MLAAYPTSCMVYGLITCPLSRSTGSLLSHTHVMTTRSNTTGPESRPIGQQDGYRSDRLSRLDWYRDVDCKFCALMFNRVAAANEPSSMEARSETISAPSIGLVPVLTPPRQKNQKGAPTKSSATATSSNKQKPYQDDLGHEASAGCGRRVQVRSRVRGSPIATMRILRD